MKYFKALFFCIFCFLTFSQSYFFRQISVADGLAQTQINDITEDENGYLWIATLGGLSRYNGNYFENYSIENGLSNNRITALFSDKNKLWIAQESAISVLENSKIHTWNLDESNIIITDIVRYNNKIIFSSFGKGLFYFENNKIKNFQFNDIEQNRIRQLQVFDDKLYIATRNGMIALKNFNNYFTINPLKDLNISCFNFNKNKLLISDVEGNLYKVNIKDYNKQLFFKNPFACFNKNILFDGDNFYVSSDMGILWFKNFKFNQLITQQNGLPTNNIQTAYIDKNKSIWFGTSGKGLLRFSGTNVKFYQQKDGLESDLITSCTSYEGTTFFGTYDGILYSYSDNFFKKHNHFNSTIWAMEKHDNMLFIASQDGLFLWKNKIEKLILKNEKISCLFNEHDKLYIGGNKSLYCYHNGKIDTLLNNKSIGVIRSIVRYNKSLLLGTDNGIVEYKEGKYYSFSKLNIRIISLINKAGKLWIGTEEGLYIYENNSLKKFELSEESSASFINFIVSKDESIFFGTNNGVYKLINNEIIHYSLDEGLISLETNINSGFIDNKNQLWFGTSDGLVKINQNNDIFDNRQFVSLKLRDFKVNFLKVNNKNIVSNWKYDLSLNLPYNKNNLFIELEGICLKKNNNLRYEYFLEGQNTNWSPEIKNSILQFNNLSPGNYLLRIRAKNGKDNYSKELKIKIKITQVFYKTWWFIMFVSILCFLLIYLVFRYKMKSEKNRQYRELLETNNKLLTLEQESLNASMNRHFIFNSLNSIQFFINTQDKLSANKFLSNFAKLIRKNLDSSIDNEGLVSLNEEIERLSLYLSLENMRFADKFSYNINIESDIDIENIEIPTMLLQPFVENSIIHGILPLIDRKGKIDIEIIKKINDIEIKITDNGVGIEESKANKNLSYGDHKSKGVEINAKRIEILNQKQKNKYQIVGPKQIFNENHVIIGTEVLIILRNV